MNSVSKYILMFVYFRAVYGTNYVRPNIILFVVDDMGWNDVGFHGLTEIPTPNIDILAYNGIILNSYYTHPACSPSRAALLTGKYATTTGLQHMVIYDAQKVGLPLDLKTLPEMLNTLGYQSHMVGKWHLGFNSVAYTPLRRGFKSHYGFWNGDSDHFFHTTDFLYNRSTTYGIPCYETRDQFLFSGLNFRDNFTPVNRPGEYLTYLYTERATKIIDKHDKSQPLFLYLAHHGVHRGNFFLPVRAPENLTNLFTNIKDEPKRKHFAGALTAIDRSLGDIVEALSKNNMLDNTIIVFSSDNGAPIPGTSADNGASNFPLRSGKLTGWEGGVRTNAFVWSSRFRNKGSVYDGMIHISDWLPTLYAAAGGRKRIEQLLSLDGMNLWDAIKNNRSSPRTNIVLQSDPIYNLKSYRSGDYKLVSGQIESPTFTNGYYGAEGRGPPPSTLSNKGSKTLDVLKRVFGRSVKITGNPVLVNCGDKSLSVSCDPVKEDCLFNVKEDPCEYRNIAKINPDILTRLKKELQDKYVQDPNFPNGDYASNPVYYNGFYGPWVDRRYNINSTSC